MKIALLLFVKTFSSAVCKGMNGESLLSCALLIKKEPWETLPKLIELHDPLDSFNLLFVSVGGFAVVAFVATMGNSLFITTRSN